MDIISISTVEEIASLARLELTEKEKKMYAEQLSVVFDYIEMLNEVNTEDVPETSQVTGLQDVFRGDVAKAKSAAIVEDLVSVFPEKAGNMLKVTAVFDAQEEKL